MKTLLSTLAVLFSTTLAQASYVIPDGSIAVRKFNTSTVSYINNKNFLYNGEFRFWQRQVPGTLTNTQDDLYSADRWYILNSGGAVNMQGARVAETFSASPTQYVGQFRQGDATPRQYGIAQILPNADVLTLRGQTVTFSLYARTDGTEVANLRMGIVEWTGTADSVTSDIVDTWAATPTLIANAAFANTPASQATTGTMAQLSVTATLGTTFNNLIVFVWTPTAEAQNDDFYVTQTQLGLGTLSKPWTSIALPYGTDLARCQMFYEKSYDTDVAPGTSTQVGNMRWVSPRTITPSEGLANDVYKVTKFKTGAQSNIWTTTGVSASVYNVSAATTHSATVETSGQNGHALYWQIVDGNFYAWQWTAESEL